MLFQSAVSVSGVVRPRSALGRLFLVLSLAFAVSVGSSPIGHAAGSGVALNSYEARLVTLVNAARHDNGLAALTVTPGATDVARRWAANQAANDRMTHNPQFAEQLAAAGGKNWRWAAENVGYGFENDPDGLFALYMHSALHRANILSPQARNVGMGVSPRASGAWLMVYNTMNFNDSYDASYGASRVPAAALTPAASADPAPADGTQPILTAQDSVTWTVRDVATRTARYADVRMAGAVDLSTASSLQLRLKADTARATPIRVTVLLSRAGGRLISLGTVSVTTQRTTFSFGLSDSTRSRSDAITLRVRAASSTKLPFVTQSRSLRVSLVALRVVA